jgi:uncharacterized protein YxjI
MNFNLYTISQNGLLSQTYDVRQDGHVVYTAKRTFFFKKCTLFDAYGAEIFVIRRDFAIFQLKFTIEHEGRVYASIVSKGAFSNGLNIHVEEDLYEVRGTFWMSEFTILKNGMEIAKISRKKFSMKDKIGIAISENQDDELILAFVFVIEMMIRVKKSKSG